MDTSGLELILLQQIQAVGPVLHHASSLFDVLGMVVGPAYRVRIDMGKLRINPLVRITNLVERGGDGRTNAMAGKAAVVSQAFHAMVERVFANAFFQILDPCEQVLLGGPHAVEHVTNDLYCLDRERNDVRRDILRAQVLLLHFQFQLLYHVRWNDP